jgi:hypothetical protein
MADGTTTTAPPSGSLEETALNALLELVKVSSSPEIAQSQAIMLRRLALEGDVVGSRIPAPTTISEVGGYVNLLSDLGQPEMRAQMLAGALGVSGPNPPLGWLPTQPVLGWVTIANDRPAGAAQPSIPLSITLRSDFAPGIQAALKTLHDQGCALPLLSPPRSLPAGAGPAPADVMPLLGRSLDVVPNTALQDPDADPLALARQGTDPYVLVARVLSPGTVPVAAQPWDALQCTAAACTTIAPPAAGRAYVEVDPLLAAAGFYPTSSGQPASATDLGWSHYSNTTGLVANQTTLADELSLLYSQNEIATSALVGRLSDVWDGATFAGA